MALPRRAASPLRLAPYHAALDAGGHGLAQQPLPLGALLASLVLQNRLPRQWTAVFRAAWVLHAQTTFRFNLHMPLSLCGRHGLLMPCACEPRRVSNWRHHDLSRMRCAVISAAQARSACARRYFKAFQELRTRGRRRPCSSSCSCSQEWSSTYSRSNASVSSASSSALRAACAGRCVHCNC